MIAVKRFIDKLNEWADRGFGVFERLTQSSAEVPRQGWVGKPLGELVGVPINTISSHVERGKLPPRRRDEHDQLLPYYWEDVEMLRAFYRTLPWRRQCLTMAIQNLKGGSWKTSTTWTLGSYFAKRGYRTLMLDMDPQATLSLLCGYTPDMDVGYEDSIAMYLNGDRDPKNVMEVVRDTRQSNLKLIPSSIGTAMLSEEFANRLGRQSFQRGPDGKLIEEAATSLMGQMNALKNALSHLHNSFDLILIDGTPSIGMLSTNLIQAADVVVLPVPLEHPDLASTISYMAMLAQNQEGMEELGLELEEPQMVVLPTRFTNTDSNVAADVYRDLRQTFTSVHTVEDEEGNPIVNTESGEPLLEEVCYVLNSESYRHEQVYSNCSKLRVSPIDFPVKEVRGFGRQLIANKAMARALENIEQIGSEIHDELLLPLWEALEESADTPFDPELNTKRWLRENPDHPLTAMMSQATEAA